MTAAELMEQTLETVVERIGDPAPRVYERVFAAAPELRALFVRDERGSVRGEMFHRAVEALVDAARDKPHVVGMIDAERINHDGIGVTPRQFESFFDAVFQVCREALGPDWTNEIDTAWRATLARVGVFSATAG